MSLGSKGLFSFRRRCNTYHRYIVSFRRWNRLYMKHRCWHQYRTHSSLGNLEQRIITILYSKYGKNGNRFSISFWLNYTLELDGFSIKLFQYFLCALWTSSRKPSQALKVLCAGIHITLISKEQKYQHSPILDIQILKSQLLLNIRDFVRLFCEIWPFHIVPQMGIRLSKSLWNFHLSVMSHLSCSWMVTDD